MINNIETYFKILWPFPEQLPLKSHFKRMKNSRRCMRK